MAKPAPPHVLPALTGKESAVVIFLHHSGVSGISWAKRFESMRLPHVRYVFPNAPVRALTLYDGLQQTAWFDVFGYSSNSKHDEKGLAETTSRVHRLIEEEIARGVPSERILLAGYSQGGSAALYACVMYSKPLAGGVIINSWFPDFRQDVVVKKLHPSNVNTRILQMHGDNDPFIHVKYANAGAEFCKKCLTNFTYKMYKNSSHWPTSDMDRYKIHLTREGDNFVTRSASVIHMILEAMRKFISDRLPDVGDQ